MWYTSPKAIAASHCPVVRDVGCGVKGCPHQQALASSIRVCSTPDSRHAAEGPAELRSVPGPDLSMPSIHAD